MIEEITESEIEPLMPYVMADPNTITFSPKANYYGAKEGGVLVAIHGVIFYKNKAVAKSAFSHPQHRRKGYYRALLKHIWAVCKERGVPYVEANVYPVSSAEWIKAGAQIVKRFKNGVVTIKLFL